MHAWCTVFLPTLLKGKKRQQKGTWTTTTQHTQQEIKVMRMNERMAQTPSSSLSYYPLLNKAGGCDQRVCPPPKCSNCTQLCSPALLSGKDCTSCEPSMPHVFCSLTMRIYICNWKLANGCSGLAWPDLTSLC